MASYEAEHCGPIHRGVGTAPFKDRLVLCSRGHLKFYVKLLHDVPGKHWLRFYFNFHHICEQVEGRLSDSVFTKRKNKSSKLLSPYINELVTQLKAGTGWSLPIR